MAEAPDFIKALVRDYNDATLLEKVATRPEDKRKFLILRNFLLLALGEVLREVVWH